MIQRTRLLQLSLFLSLILLIGCASDRSICANSAAAYTYYEWKFEQECLDEYHVECIPRYEALKKMKKQVEICNTVQKIGNLPSTQKKELKKISNDVDRTSR